VFDPERDAGINGVWVSLYADTDDDGRYTPGVDRFVERTRTHRYDDMDGHYRFEDLCAGDYIVVVEAVNFEPGGVLHEHVTTLGDTDPDNDIDHDDNGVMLAGGGAASFAVTLIPGTEPITDGDNDANTNLTLDLGFYHPAAGGRCELSLGDRIWIDPCYNNPCDDYTPSLKPGMPKVIPKTVDPDESGVNGIRVLLYRDSDRSGDYTPGVDAFVAETLTRTCTECGPDVTGCGRAGYYLFEHLCEDDYIVRIDPANWAQTGILFGHDSLPGAPDPDDDVNNDDNGEPMAGEGVVTRAVTLKSGTEPVDDGDQDANTNLTVDMGLFPVD